MVENFCVEFSVNYCTLYMKNSLKQVNLEYTRSWLKWFVSRSNTGLVYIIVFKSLLENYVLHANGTSCWIKHITEVLNTFDMQETSVNLSGKNIQRTILVLRHNLQTTQSRFQINGFNNADQHKLRTYFEFKSVFESEFYFKWTFSN